MYSTSATSSNDQAGNITNGNIKTNINSNSSVNPIPDDKRIINQKFRIGGNEDE